MTGVLPIIIRGGSLLRKIDRRGLTADRKKTILKKYDYTCVYCFCDGDNVDHIIPWSYTHDDSEDNLVVACWICNLIASNRVFDTFEEKQIFIQNRKYQWIRR